MYSIISVTENLQAELQSRLDKISLRWKGSEDTDSYSEAKPTVYAFTYDEIRDGYPLKTPSILVQCVEMQSGQAQFLVHVCVCNPAKQDAEITNPVDGMNGVYEYEDGDDITSDCVRGELYRACLMLGEQVFIALEQMARSNHSISDISLETPSSYMDDFPYCECSVSFTVKMSKNEYVLKSKLHDML